MRLSYILLFTLFLVNIVPAQAATQYLAQGNPISVNESVSTGTCWFFPSNGPANPVYFDYPPSVIQNQSVCEIPDTYTVNLPAEKYTLFYEMPANISGTLLKDISWSSGTLTSSLAKTNKINEVGKQSQDIQKDFLNMIATDNINAINETDFFIQAPFLHIGSIGANTTLVPSVQTLSGANPNSTVSNMIMESQDFYDISGTSNFANGENIRIEVDPDRYFAEHNQSFTYYTTVSKDPYEQDGTWSAKMYLPLSDMPPGWHNVSVFAGSLETTVRFKIDQVIVPTPTPTEIANYFSNGDIAPVTVTVPYAVIVTQTVDIWHTATPTPTITDALGEKTDYPYEPGKTIPATAGILCAIGAAILVLIGRRK